MPPKTGSQANAPSITLSTLVITSPPPPTPTPPPPKSEKPVVATTPANVIAKAPQPKPEPVEEAVPVLATQSPKTSPAPPKHAAAPPVAKAAPMKLKPAASAPFASSYAPGINTLPHPPYPEEAQNLGETGTVVMTVTFNTDGDVTQAEVAQSSGVRLLDTTTCSFILTHWHSATFAGQTVVQPVRYTGE